MKLTKYDVPAMLAELAAVCECAHKLILVRELATSHKLEQMLSVRVREKDAAWKREDDFGRDQFNDWKARGCNKFISVLGGNGMKIAPTGDIFDQPPGQMR